MGREPPTLPEWLRVKEDVDNEPWHGAWGGIWPPPSMFEGLFAAQHHIPAARRRSFSPLTRSQAAAVGDPSLAREERLPAPSRRVGVEQRLRRAVSRLNLGRNGGEQEKSKTPSPESDKKEQEEAAGEKKKDSNGKRMLSRTYRSVKDLTKFWEREGRQDDDDDGTAI